MKARPELSDYCDNTVTPRRFCAQAVSSLPGTSGRSLP
jgi:hypothetical protein